MQEIPLTTEPNQQFSVRLADQRFLVRLKEARGVMVADISIDGAVILEATRVLAGEPLIPYTYLERGNLVLITDDGELPTYDKFGVTQFLVYLSPEEIAAL